MASIPFLPEFHQKVLDGRKTATARSKPYGKPGDRLQGPAGCTLVLDSVEQKRLGEVADQHYHHEGLDDPEEFIEVWVRIHPRKALNLNDLVWFHRFHREA